MHPLRRRLHNELHARPSLYFDEPAQVFHLAFIGSDQECYAFLENCCPGSLDLNASQGITQLDGHALKWERHAEFFTLTLVVTSSGNDLSWTSLPEVLAQNVEAHLPQLINSVQIVVRGEAHLDLSRYGFKDPSGSCVGGGDAMVWSDFHLSEDGSNHILFVNRRLNAYRQGRMIRRLLEIETYRMMASLSLTTAKDLSEQLNVFDKTLVTLSERNTESDGSNAKALLADISNLSAQVVSSTAKTRHRFGATQAYAQLVFERLGELRESHVGDCQRLGVFIERRFKLTVRYCSVRCSDQDPTRRGRSVDDCNNLLPA